MKKYILKNCNIQNADNYIENTDVTINKGKIEKIGKLSINDTEAETIDLKGKTIIPGGIDPHVHLSLPTPVGNSCDDFFTGSIAALAGGTTTIIDFVTPQQGESFIDALNKRKAEAENCLIDYSFHLSPTWWNGNSAKEIEQAIKNEGITSFKVYLAYKGSVGIDDDVLINVFDAVKQNKGIITVHCEHGDLINYLRAKYIQEGKFSPKYHALSRPVEAEVEAVNRVIYLARYFDCPVYIVHVSSGEALKLIEAAQKNGQKVFAETCPHYFTLTDDLYAQPFEESAKYIISPPLRTKDDQSAILKAIKNKTIQTLGTDHCPFHLKGQKDAGLTDFTKVPNGAGGIEYRLSLFMSNMQYSTDLKQKLADLVRIACAEPAKIFGLFDRKGEIAVGKDADIVVWNNDLEITASIKTQFQKCDSNIYEGMILKGAPEIVFSNGVIAFHHGKIFPYNLKGKFLYRKTE